MLSIPLTGDALLWDADVNCGAFSAAHGKDKTLTVITASLVRNLCTSSDAINGSQLYTTSGTSLMRWVVTQKSTLTAPSPHRHTIANAEYNNVGDATDALDDNALLWDETANGVSGAYNASHDGKASIITNVANGSISEDSTDTVNGSQLNATNMIEQNTKLSISSLVTQTQLYPRKRCGY